MDTILRANLAASIPTFAASDDRHFSILRPSLFRYSLPPRCFFRRHQLVGLSHPSAIPLHAEAAGSGSNSCPPRENAYTVGDFMTRKEHLHVVKTTTVVEEALDTLAQKRITGFPVVDDEWKLVGVVSDYDLLALDSISGGGLTETTLFPDVDSTWKTFSEIQKLLTKTNGKLVGDLMTASPLYIHESTSLEDAARLLLETKFRRLPVVDADGKLVGIITRGDVVRAALKIKRANQRQRRI